MKMNIYFWSLIVDRVFLQMTQDCLFIFCGNVCDLETLSSLL